MRSSPALRSLLLAAVGSTVLAGAAAAQSTPPTANAPTTLDDVVVTGAPYGVSQRAAVIATDVLDEETLATAPAASLGDLLNGRPGVRSTDFAPGASRPVIRGLSGPRVQVLTNGIGLIDASSVSPDHAVATDPAEANRIEIIRGPATLVYGGSAIGGVVNVLDDRIPTAIPEGGIDGVVSAQASSVDDGRGGFARVTAGAGNFAFNVDAVKRKTDDYEIPAPTVSARLAAAEGIARDDGIIDAQYLARKIVEMRVFESAGGKPMDRSVAAVGGGILGNIIDGGHNRAAGTLIGGALGALAGKSIDQKNSDVRCR